MTYLLFYTHYPFTPTSSSLQSHLILISSLPYPHLIPTSSPPTSTHIYYSTKGSNSLTLCASFFSPSVPFATGFEPSTSSITLTKRSTASSEISIPSPTSVLVPVSVSVSFSFSFSFSFPYRAQRSIAFRLLHNPVATPPPSLHSFPLYTLSLFHPPKLPSPFPLCSALSPFPTLPTLPLL